MNEKDECNLLYLNIMLQCYNATVHSVKLHDLLKLKDISLHQVSWRYSHMARYAYWPKLFSPLNCSKICPRVTCYNSLRTSKTWKMCCTVYNHVLYQIIYLLYTLEMLALAVSLKQNYKIMINMLFRKWHLALYTCSNSIVPFEL